MPGVPTKGSCRGVGSGDAPDPVDQLPTSCPSRPTEAAVTSQPPASPCAMPSNVLKDARTKPQELFNESAVFGYQINKYRTEFQKRERPMTLATQLHAGGLVPFSKQRPPRDLPSTSRGTLRQYCMYHSVCGDQPVTVCRNSRG